MRKQCQQHVAALTLALCLAALPLIAQAPPPAQGPLHLRADPAQGEFALELNKAGLLKMFGDDHLIRVTNYQCDLLYDEQRPQDSSVRVLIPTAAIQVVDPGLDADKRAEVQQRMEGPEVLETPRYPQIVYLSTGVKPLGKGRFRVEGTLSIRQVQRPVTLEVELKPAEGGAYFATSEVKLRQTDFGIQPVSVAGGAVKVRDEMKVRFRLRLVPVGP